MIVPNWLYQKWVNEALDTALSKADNEGVLEMDLKSGKWVIFSDHHKRTRDGADDFSDSEDVYHLPC